MVARMTSTSSSSEERQTASSAAAGSLSPPALWLSYGGGEEDAGVMDNDAALWREADEREPAEERWDREGGEEGKAGCGDAEDGSGKRAEIGMGSTSNSAGGFGGMDSTSTVMSEGGEWEDGEFNPGMRVRKKQKGERYVSCWLIQPRAEAML
jgi:hypothetical protein